MVFSSIVFLFYFLPVMAALYAIAPRKLRNAALLLGSLFFYAWGEPKYVLVMVCQILPCYVLGLLVERYRERRAGQLLCALSVAVSLSFLIYFKYTDFFLENINAVTGLSLPLIRVALPIGISFYTFQMISYTADVYRGEAAQRNLLSLSLYRDVPAAGRRADRPVCGSFRAAFGEDAFVGFYRNGNPAFCGRTGEKDPAGKPAVGTLQCIPRFGGEVRPVLLAVCRSFHAVYLF